MVQLTTAGRLLGALHAASPAERDAVAFAAGLSAERADAAMIGALRLSLSEQLRLSEATIVMAPAFTRHALRLRAQVLAARSFEARDLVEPHAETPPQRWETSPRLPR